MPTLGEMYAKTENVHEVIVDFVEQIDAFKQETSKSIDNIQDVINNMDWNSNVADKIKDKVNAFSEKINYSLAEIEKVKAKLTQKAEGYQEILEQLKKAIAG